MDKFEAMQVFVRVVEKGSFSAVAKERGTGQPAVSKQISALEDALGIELIHRTSRSITLTDAGRDFYESALRMLEDFDLAAVIAHLEAHGVTVGESGRRYGAGGFGVSVYLCDPEGNGLELRG